MEASMAQGKKKKNKHHFKCHTAAYLQKSISIARAIMEAKMMSRESCS